MFVVARRRTLTVAAVSVVLAALAVVIPAPADADIDVAVTVENSALAIAETFVAPDVLVSASFVTKPPTPLSTGIGSEGFDSPWPTAGNDFAVLSSGDVRIAPQANVSGSSGIDLGGPTIRGNTDFDVTILRVDVQVPATVNCLVGVDFQFFSEEYPEFVGSRFNDAFIAELDQSTWTTSGSAINAPDNFAFDEAGDPITINTVGATTMTPAEAAGTTYDGATPLLRATTPITPGDHSLYFSIFDQGDGIYDSAVFIDNLQFGTVADVERDCKPGAAPAEQFVYVALGDSYSSGEGAPPFEDGTNYPFNDPQENTLTDRFGGNGCHRSLVNYAKNNDGRFEPDQPFALVDRTCSGAEVEPEPGASKPPIAATRNTPAPQLTQVDEALDRLDSNFGFTGDDVDLVTMSMGGNDAKFGEIVQACLLPNLARELFRAYPGEPWEVRTLVERFGTCERIDGLAFNSADALDTLLQKEFDAQQDILTTFTEARVLQLTYPSIVPAADDYPGEVCGGLLRQDANYARSRVTAINDVIREAIDFNRSFFGFDELQVVDIENAFGENPICPADPSEALAVGIDQDRLVGVIDGLLEEGTETRALLDDLNDEYRDWRNCMLWDPLFFLESHCRTDDLEAAATGIADYFLQGDRIDDLVGSLMPGANPDERFENSRNLFHPTAKGFQVMACQVLEVWQFGTTSNACAPNSMLVKLYEWDDAPLTGASPIQLVPGTSVSIRFNGWDPGSGVGVFFFSQPVQIGDFTADATGEIGGDITIPVDAQPGVHTVELVGTNGGNPRLVDVLVEVPGRPIGGQVYGLYLDGFTPGEEVDVTFAGEHYITQRADESGGVHVEIPMPDPLQPFTFDVAGTGLESGVTSSQTISPTPTSAALWATSGADDAITLRGGPEVTGYVHSEGGIDLGGNASLTSGAEYGTTMAAAGSASVDPAAVQAQLDDVPPVSVDPDAWRPGGAVAAELGDAYQIVDAGDCEGGTWKPKAADLTGEVIYVPCDVQLSGQLGQVAATVVAEGTVKANANGAEFVPSTGRPALVAISEAPDALEVSSANATFAGPLVARGGASVSGAGNVFSCGIYASTISITSGGSTFAACRNDDL